MEQNRVTVQPVPPGSLVVIAVPDLDGTWLANFRKSLVERVGHDRFLVLHLSEGPAGAAKVYGPEELTAKMREALA